jgi:hypothetical protein
MTDGMSLFPVPTEQSLVAAEETAAAWIDGREDPDELRRAHALLEAWRQHYMRGSAEADAAKRLHLRAERRLGMLLPKRRPGRPAKSEQVVQISAAERVAESRARALASVPSDLFEEELAKPKPSRERILAKALTREPTADPALDESRRLLKVVWYPPRDSWPDRFEMEHLNAGAISTIEEEIATLRKWATAWEAALASSRNLRPMQ